MELCTRFDDELIQEYVARDAKPIFTIYWEHEGRAYPADDWIDFGTVILDWWLIHAESLIRDGTPARLDFMDGPYCLHITRFGQVLRIEAEIHEFVWECTLQEFIKSMRTATWSVIRRLDDLGLEEHDRYWLEHGLRKLTEAIGVAPD